MWRRGGPAAQHHLERSCDFRTGPGARDGWRPRKGRAATHSGTAKWLGGALGGKPTIDDLGIDVNSLAWQRSGDGNGTIEVAFARVPGPHGGQASEWVLMRVAGDPAGRVLVYDRNEWECFLDGVRNNEFDDALDG